jgi:hypothetical protein
MLPRFAPAWRLPAGIVQSAGASYVLKEFTRVEQAMTRSDLEVGYKLLEECILSGQVSSRQLAQMMRGDPKFAEWLRARASVRRRTPTFSERLAVRPIPGPQTTEDISLISLAAWLHRASKRAERGNHAIEAARLGQASEVVKDAADRERQDLSVPAPRPLAANEG